MNMSSGRASPIDTTEASKPDHPGRLRSQTPTSMFYEKCERASLLPEPIIQKALACKDGVLNLRDTSSYSIGDSLLLALADSLGGIETLSKISFKDNRLSDKGLSAMVKGLSRSRVRELDLSRNYFNAKGIAHIAPLLTSPSSPLMDLNLENNSLGDRGVVVLASALAESRNLTRLNLSRCNIGHQGATALGNALCENASLVELFLSWNKIRGYGATKLAQGLQLSVSLQTLDLSWNSFGSITTSDALRALGASLMENNVLTHLDLSHNRLLEKDCQVLSTALKGNTSIRGLHIGGNDLDIDAYGFVFPDAAQNDPAGAHIFSRFGFKCSKQGKNDWEKRSNCWICERWAEVRFTWKQHAKKPGEVFFRAEFDYWQPHHALPSAHDPTMWEIHRMVPPGMTQFFFVIDGVPQTTDAHIVQKFQARVWGGVSNYSRGLDMPASNEVNIVRVDETDVLADLKCKPRSKTPGPNQEDDWFAKSVFCTFQQDTTQHLNNAFEADWNASRLPKLTKDAADLDRAKHMLAKSFAMLKSVFKHYATTGGTDPFTLGSNAFFDFISDCDIIDQDTCTRAEVEMNFISSSSSGPKVKWNTRRNLFRFQFIEAIAFLAVSKFFKSKRASSVSEAISMLLQHHIKPRASWHDSQEYRTHKSYAQPTCLFSPQVDMIFKDHLYLLKELFASFAGTIDTTPAACEKSKRLSFAEFMYLCEQGNLVDESLPARDLKLALMRSKETEIFDPHGDGEEWKRINFGEFLEACARMSDAKDYTQFYERVKVAHYGVVDGGDTTQYEFLKVKTSSLDQWRSQSGNFGLKLPVFLKQLCLPIVRARKVSVPALMVRQITTVASTLQLKNETT
ncbi:hypothetical protein H310_06541 [Aphanomyces invadans]|uniref:Uncharacterized protein n=1 Tax=Aphanomyces invadans TaxID=157072 RepID=A0A024U6Y0_9STRA|nr:hypothetical protein H310_06541 [Aphanomyces invadans]ETW02024.1 hypothetical protein H310_06541 [Aphanomyces invadans]|eukprot:XP_008869872.1 hypothetical protein H310_06541 [Aphanomyces invadans]